jgi:hypothetical protein
MRRIVLPDTGRDLSWFRVEGSVDGSPVSASWDGHVLEVADRLIARVALARAVDMVYRDAGVEVDGCGVSITKCARLAMLSLIELCEDLTCVEYESKTGSNKLV